MSQLKSKFVFHSVTNGLSAFVLAIVFLCGVGWAQDPDMEGDGSDSPKSKHKTQAQDNADDNENDDGTFDLMEIGEQAPPLNTQNWLTDNNGLLPKFKKFESGRVYVIHFFLTGNEYTVQQFLPLAKLQRKHIDDNVQVVAVSPETVDVVEEFFDGQLPEGVKQDASFDGLETYFDLMSSISSLADPSGEGWAKYQGRSGRETYSVFVVGKSGKVEWVGSPEDIDKPLMQIVAGSWDRKKFAKTFSNQQQRFKDKSSALAKFARWQAKQMRGRQGLSLDDLKEILADGFGDPENKSFRLLIQKARVDILLLLLDADLPEVMRSYTDLVEDPSDGIELNNTAWAVYEAYEAGRIKKDSEFMKAAKYMAEKAIKFEPDSAAVNDTIAHFVYLMDGDLDKAIQYQRKALANAEDARTEDLQPFLEFLLSEKKTGEKKSLQKEQEDDSDETDF